jgi:prepilin signal peptidase PulO-like enzyme (type II secretory pathway)
LQGIAAVYVFTLDAVLGSFLNVVIYRLPRGLNIVLPRSRCPVCATPIECATTCRCSAGCSAGALSGFSPT